VITAEWSEKRAEARRNACFSRSTSFITIPFHFGSSLISIQFQPLEKDMKLMVLSLNRKRKNTTQWNEKKRGVVLFSFLLTHHSTHSQQVPGFKI